MRPAAASQTSGAFSKIRIEAPARSRLRTGEGIGTEVSGGRLVASGRAGKTINGSSEATAGAGFDAVEASVGSGLLRSFSAIWIASCGLASIRAGSYDSIWNSSTPTNRFSDRWERPLPGRAWPSAHSRVRAA